MTRGRYTTDQPSIAQQLADLKRRIQDLESGNRAGATSVDKGSFAVASGSFTVSDLLEFGNVNFGAGASNGFIFYRADGTVMFTLGGGSNADQFWALWDNSGNIVVSDDGVSNQGLASPYIPIAFTSSAANTTFPDNTTSGTFTGLLTARYVKQHPQVYCAVLVRTSDGTTAGEMQLAIGGGGPILSSVVSIPAGSFGLLYVGPCAVPGQHQDEVELELQVRRTAGTGNVGVRMFGSYAIGS